MNKKMVAHLANLSPGDLGQEVSLWPVPGTTTIVSLATYWLPVEGGEVLSPDERGIRLSTSMERRVIGMTNDGYVVGRLIEECYEGRKSRLVIMGTTFDLAHAVRALGWKEKGE